MPKPSMLTLCFTVLWKEAKRPQSNTKEMLLKQANRTAWKILSDWTEIQHSMILLKQAEPLQMFLFFMHDMKSNETLFYKVTRQNDFVIGAVIDHFIKTA